MIIDCIRIKFDDNMEMSRLVKDADVDNLPMPRDAMYMDLVTKNSETGEVLNTKRLVTNAEFVDTTFEVNSDYYIVYNFYDGKAYVRGTDKPALNNRYIPKNCTFITLYTKEEYRASLLEKDSLAKYARDRHNLIDRLTDIVNADIDSKQRCKELREGLKQLVATDSELYTEQFRRRVFFGEMMSLDEVVEEFGVLSLQSMLIESQNADGLVICCDEDNIENYKLLTYCDWEEPIQGEFSEKRRLVFEKELEYVLGEEENETQEEEPEIEDDDIDKMKDLLNRIDKVLTKIEREVARTKKSTNKNPNENTDK